MIAARPSSRPLLLPWTLAPLAVGAGAGPGDDATKSAQAGLEAARQRVRTAGADLQEAESRARAAAADREYREKHRDRVVGLSQTDAVDRPMVEDEEERVRTARAEERAARRSIGLARIRLDGARAQVGEAEALRDLAELEARGDRAAGEDMKRARVRLREAKLEIARLGLREREVALQDAEDAADAAKGGRIFRETRRNRARTRVNRLGRDEGSLAEEEHRYRLARAAERRATLDIDRARAEREVAEAEVREARAELDLARAGAMAAPGVHGGMDPEIARAERAVSEHQVKVADARRSGAAAARQLRAMTLDRLTELSRQGLIERRRLDEARDQYQTAQADEVAGKAGADLARAEAAAEDRPRADRKPVIGAEFRTLQEARGRLARALCVVARVEVERAQAEREAAGDDVAEQTRQSGRFRERAAEGSVAPRLVEEKAQALDAARHDERKAEAAVGLARARLALAEARLRAVEAEAGADRSP